MANFVGPGRPRESIDEVMAPWRERCLLADGSFLFEDRDVWSLPHLRDFRQRISAGAILGTEENFEEKLQR